MPPSSLPTLVFNSPFEPNDRRKVSTVLSQRMTPELTRVCLRFAPKREKQGNLLATELRRTLQVLPHVAISAKSNPLAKGYELTLEFADNPTQSANPGQKPNSPGSPIVGVVRTWFNNKILERERRIYESLLRDAMADAAVGLDSAQRREFRTAGSVVHVHVYQDKRLCEQLRVDRSFVKSVLSLKAELRPTAQLDVRFDFHPETILAGQPLIEIEIEAPVSALATSVPTLMHGSVRVTSLLVNGKEVTLDKPADLALPATISRNTWLSGELAVDGKPVVLTHLPRSDQPLELREDGNEVTFSRRTRYHVLFDMDSNAVSDSTRLRSGDTYLIRSDEDAYLVLEIG